MKAYREWVVEASRIASAVWLTHHVEPHLSKLGEIIPGVVVDLLALVLSSFIVLFTTNTLLGFPRLRVVWTNPDDRTEVSGPIHQLKHPGGLPFSAEVKFLYETSSLFGWLVRRILVSADYRAVMEVEGRDVLKVTIEKQPPQGGVISNSKSQLQLPLAITSSNSTCTWAELGFEVGQVPAEHRAKIGYRLESSNANFFFRGVVTLVRINSNVEAIDLIRVR